VPATDEFASRFHAMVDELDRAGRTNEETMWHLGSIAGRLVTDARADNWTDLKLRLDRATLEATIDTLEAEAAGFDAANQPKPAFAARLLGMSLVAGTLTDPLLRQRDLMLNMFIDTAAIVFIQTKSALGALRN
jgi:hypothetical protein